jgi:hypothetical protein
MSCSSMWWWRNLTTQLVVAASKGACSSGSNTAGDVPDDLGNRQVVTVSLHRVQHHVTDERRLGTGIARLADFVAVTKAA